MAFTSTRETGPGGPVAKAPGRPALRQTFIKYSLLLQRGKEQQGKQKQHSALLYFHVILKMI